MKLPLTPYRIEKEFDYVSLRCVVVLQSEAGHRCGYVCIPSNHPDFGKNYDDINVSVHGGLTFAEMDVDGKHYWVGFDCAHAGDAFVDPDIDINAIASDEARSIVGIHRSFTHHGGEHYWSQKDVESELKHLAKQLARRLPKEEVFRAIGD